MNSGLKGLRFALTAVLNWKSESFFNYVNEFACQNRSDLVLANFDSLLTPDQVFPLQVLCQKLNFFKIWNALLLHELQVLFSRIENFYEGEKVNFFVLSYGFEVRVVL